MDKSTLLLEMKFFEEKYKEYEMLTVFNYLSLLMCKAQVRFLDFKNGMEQGKKYFTKYYGSKYEIVEFEKVPNLIERYGRSNIETVRSLIPCIHVKMKARNGKIIKKSISYNCIFEDVDIENINPKEYKF